MLEFIYVLNVLLALTLICWPIWFARKYLGLSYINPLSIHVVITLPVELMKLIVGPMFSIESGLFDIGYQYAVAATNLHTASGVLGCIFFFKLFGFYRIESLLPFLKARLSPVKLNYFSNFYLFLFATFFFLLASNEFGVVNWILNPREGYQLYRTGQGHWFALAIYALSVSFYLRCLSYRNTNKIIRAAIFYFCISYLLGSKGVMLWYFESTLIILWLVGYKKLKIIAIIGLPLIFATMVFNLFLALGTTFDLNSIIEYFDFYTNGASYYRAFHYEEISLFYGDVFLSSFWEYIPRFIWPDKPVIYGITMINEIFYPGQAELTNTPAFGGAVTQFADFGWLGLVVFGFFGSNALIFALCGYWFYCKPKVAWHQISPITAILLIGMYAPGFGAFFPIGFQVLLVLFTFFVIFFFVRKYRIRRIA
jgi:hypothetical protein